jgi:predicted nuclease of predicted toxin-antitoxin system
MRFLVDAQPPKHLAEWLNEAGHDAVHTLDLPRGNRTSDAELNDVALREQRIVVSKDSDFVASLLVTGHPARLLLVATGNISNVELESLVRANLPAIEASFAGCRFLELGRESLLVHE